MKTIILTCKKTQSRISILILSFFLLAISCHKKPVEDPLHPTNYPSPTFTGADKLVCKIDGEFFEIINGSALVGTNSKWVNYDGGKLVIKGYDNGMIKEGLSRTITINIGALNKLGSYEIIPKFNYYSTVFNSASISSSQSGFFETDSIYNGSVSITKIDTNIQKRIICGTFSFKALNKKTNQITVVSDGWFDLLYY
ncbi:MAG: hypothetical protein RJA07_691 [Bacteroidota bacterium]|jgi:hypothetical protein